MKFLRVIFLFAAILSFKPTEAQVKIISEQSRVTFEVSNLKIRTVDGSFTGMSGEINFDENNLPDSGFGVCIDASTVDTGNKKRDEHLKREDFFYVEKYPNICFESLNISKTDAGFSTKGELTMHGYTREVEIPFTFDGKIFEGTLTVNRDDYKVGEDYGKFTVGKEIDLKIVCVIE